LQARVELEHRRDAVKHDITHPRVPSILGWTKRRN
jgi:hypothetical protein